MRGPSLVEWVLERRFSDNTIGSYIKIGTSTLESCIQFWNGYYQAWPNCPIENYWIRNVNTDEIIPCAALV